MNLLRLPTRLKLRTLAGAVAAYEIKQHFEGFKAMLEHVSGQLRGIQRGAPLLAASIFQAFHEKMGALPEATVMDAIGLPFDCPFLIFKKPSFYCGLISPIRENILPEHDESFAVLAQFLADLLGLLEPPADQDEIVAALREVARTGQVNPWLAERYRSAMHETVQSMTTAALREENQVTELHVFITDQRGTCPDCGATDTFLYAMPQPSQAVCQQCAEKFICTLEKGDAGPTHDDSQTTTLAE